MHVFKKERLVLHCKLLFPLIWFISISFRLILFLHVINTIIIFSLPFPLGTILKSFKRRKRKRVEIKIKGYEQLYLVKYYKQLVVSIINSFICFSPNDKMHWNWQRLFVEGLEHFVVIMWGHYIHQNQNRYQNDKQ